MNDPKIRKFRKLEEYYHSKFIKTKQQRHQYEINRVMKEVEPLIKINKLEAAVVFMKLVGGECELVSENQALWAIENWDWVMNFVDTMRRLPYFDGGAEHAHGIDQVRMR